MPNIPEQIWAKAEQNMARRERGRLRAAGTIKFVSVPNILVRSADGGWRFPSLKGA